MKLVTVTRTDGKRTFLLWGTLDGWFWHMGNPSKRAWITRHQQQRERAA